MISACSSGISVPWYMSCFVLTMALYHPPARSMYSNLDTSTKGKKKSFIFRFSPLVIYSGGLRSIISLRHRCSAKLEAFDAFLEIPTLSSCALTTARFRSAADLKCLRHSARCILYHATLSSSPEAREKKSKLQHIAHAPTSVLCHTSFAARRNVRSLVLGFFFCAHGTEDVVYSNSGFVQPSSVQAALLRKEEAKNKKQKTG